jgi:DNA (cytosine-5)-methyltransferase 3A
MEMKILSLFDGMACGYIAMLGAGVEVDRYVAYEIDKYAIKTSSHNFPNIEHKGDVFTADFTEYQDFDFLVGGSPCTYWSIAQKNGRETEASGIGWELFCQYVRALREAQPKYFIYENNKSMSKAIRASIDEAFGFEAVFINSALVSAQNRQRLYWVGRRNADGTYSKVNVEQPIDRGILLKDILESGCDLTSNDKSYCVTATYGGACSWNTIERNQRTMVAELVTVPICVNSKSGRGGVEGLQPSLQDRIYSVEGKSTAVTTAFMPYIAEPLRVGALPRPNGELSTSQAMRIYSTDGKSVNINSGGGGMGGKTGLYAIPVEFDGTTPTKAISQADGKTYRVYKVEKGTINIKGKDYPIKLADGYYIIRKLAVRECMRLQTIPEWFEFPVSDAQAYKQIGNGWTCEVIIHLINSCLAGKVDDEPEFREQIKFF